MQNAGEGLNANLDKPIPPLSKSGNEQQSVSGVDTLLIQRKFAAALARKCATDFQRLNDFEQELREQGFDDAAKKYSHALWRWVMEQTPDDLLVKINELTPSHFKFPDDDDSWHDITVDKLHYLYSRALFLTGLQYEKAHDAKWYRSFAHEFFVADKLADMEVFEALAAFKQRRRFKKEIHREQTAAWGHLKYNVLRAWLAGGLWKLPNDGERAERLNRLLGLQSKQDRISEKGFKTARERLKLVSLLRASDSPSS
jgi:hypothetical protein